MRPIINFWHICLSLILIAVTTASLADTSNKWRLEFDGSADTSGIITIQVNTPDSESIRVDIEVPFDMGENDVAKHVQKYLEAQLPKDIYHVERDDWEDVLIKKHWGEENFEVIILANTVKGVEIDLEKE